MRRRRRLLERRDPLLHLALVLREAFQPHLRVRDVERVLRHVLALLLSPLLLLVGPLVLVPRIARLVGPLVPHRVHVRRRVDHRRAHPRLDRR